jgi:uncharacterized phiE125 gp8 family phage protein
MATLVVITPPADPVPSLDEVKAHLRQDFDEDDADIESKIWGAITEFEDPNLGWLGRSILERELELRLDAFCDVIDLPNGPILQDGETYPFSIKYDDADGVEQTLSAAVYYLADPETRACRILRKPRQTWPTVSGEANCVRIRYWAGYLDDDVRINNFKSAVKLHVEMTYDGTTEARERLSETIDRLLQPYRVYR